MGRLKSVRCYVIVRTHVYAHIFNVVADAAVLHWESLAEKRSGKESSNSNDTAHPIGRNIRESDDVRWRTEEGNTCLKVSGI